MYFTGIDFQWLAGRLSLGGNFHDRGGAEGRVMGCSPCRSMLSPSGDYEFLSQSYFSISRSLISA